MSKTSQETRRALTEERGKELDKWWAINFLRYMKFQDPISPTLSDMPTEILVQVLEKLNSIEQISCRKVCPSLRTAVKNGGINFDSISLTVFDSNATMYLDGLKIRYNDAENGASIVTKNKETMIKGYHFKQVAFNDLGILLKRVREFEFQIYGLEKYTIAEYLLNALKTNQCVHAKKITIRLLPLIDICSILPYFDSKILKSIDLSCNDTNDHFEQLSQLEQWKNSKKCTMNGSLVDNIPIEHLLHFKIIEVEMEECSLQRVIEIRDKLLTRSIFEECFLRLENLNLIEIARVFQPHYSGSEEYEIEYVCNNEKFKISCYKGHGYIRSLLKIKRC